MIHEEICTYEVCKLAKEKGFDVHPPMYFHSGVKSDLREVGSKGANPNNIPHSPHISCPTQTQLQRWLREEKGVVFGISPMQEMDCDYLGWCATIYKVDENGYGLSWQEELYYNTYELALEDALKYALENLV